jgi:threonyl-tRNA synthetase
MYRSTPRSYRDLPVRLAEFGTVYRYEQSGALNGMLRVRGLTQDDAHLFCTPEQVEQEFRDTLGLVKFVLQAVGLEDYRVQLSTRDPKSDKYVGSDELWNQAQDTLRKVLTAEGMNFTECEGEAAFYGPKTDFMVRDCLGREWQLGTVQLDYNLPQRFQLEYSRRRQQTASPRDDSPSPLRIHGTLLRNAHRTLRRCLPPVACAGTDPRASAERKIRRLRQRNRCKTPPAAGFRVTADLQSARVQAKIRDAQMDLIPYMLVVGPREAETGSVALRCRIDGDLGVLTFDAALEKLTNERDQRTIRQIAKPSIPQFTQTSRKNKTNTNWTSCPPTTRFPRHPRKPPYVTPTRFPHRRTTRFSMHADSRRQRTG